MDDSTFWIILVIIAALSPLYLKQRKMINFSEAYRKKMWSASWKSIVLCLIFIASFFSSPLLFLSGHGDWGIFSAGLSIVSVMGFIWLFKTDMKELREMYKKEEEDSMYETELIKEKARLQAQKEFKEHKKNEIKNNSFTIDRISACPKPLNKPVS